LRVGDICNVEVKGNIHGAEGPKYLPVAVMEASLSKKGNTSYKVATKHGYLVRKYQRQELHFMPLLTKELLGIDESMDSFHDKPLSEQTAVSLFSVVGVTGKCKCKGDCGAPGSKCSCKSKGIFCTSKCHGGRGTKGEKKCSLYPKELTLDHCSPCNEGS
jgi:hypothetical protein